MRIISLTFLFSLILPTLSQAIPVKYEYSGTITRHQSQVFVADPNPSSEIIEDDRFGTSVVTNAIPIGTSFSGSFYFDSDASSYTLLFSVPQVSVINGEFAPGLSSISLGLPSGLATATHLGSLTAPFCSNVTTSETIIFDGGTLLDGGFEDYIQLTAGGTVFNGNDFYSCGNFDVSGLITNEFRVSTIAIIGRERSDTNPDYINDASHIPDDISQLFNAGEEMLFAIGFSNTDDTGKTVGDDFVRVSAIGNINIIRVAVPEPAPLALFGFGLLGFGLLRKRPR